MISCSLFFAAQGVIREAETGNISVFNLLDAMTPAGLPVIIQKFSVLCGLARTQHDPARIQCTLRVTLGNEQLFELPFDVDFQDKLKANWIVNIGGLVLPQPGDLTFTLLYNNETLKQYIVLIKPPQLQIEAVPAEAQE